MQQFFRSKFERLQGQVRPRVISVESYLNPGRLVLSFGLLLAAFGLGVILFPKFFAVLFGMFFLFFGAIFTIISFKLLKFKKAVETKFREMNKNSAIIVQQMKFGEQSVEPDNGPFVEVIDEKKITWH